MPFKTQITQAKHTLLYALIASAVVSCLLSYILIQSVNESNQTRMLTRRRSQAIAVVDGIESTLIRPRSGVTDLQQLPKRLIERNMRLAASGLDIASVTFYNRNGTHFFTTLMQPLTHFKPDDVSEQIRSALHNKAVSKLEFRDGNSVVRTFVPVRDGRNTVIGAAEVITDVTQTQNVFVQSNGESLAVVLLLILASTVVLHMIGSAFIRRMGDAMAARARSEEELERSQSLARVGLMVSGLSHQLRNPLSILNGIVGALNRRPSLDEQRPFLVALTEETARIIRLSEVFLDFARPIRPEIESCNVRDVVRKLEEFLRTKSPGTKVTVLGSSAIEYNLDQELVFQALVNIALNGIEAVTGQKSPEIMVTFGVAKGSLSIQVADNGPGFSKEDLDQLDLAPQPFHSTKAKGSGLGLAIADKIVNAHGGRLAFGNNPNGGARVTLIIPGVLSA